MEAMSMMKQVVNQKGAYAVEQGQRKDFTGAELAELKASATPFEELVLIENPALTVDRIEAINGKDAFAIKNGKNTYFYDTITGLKLAESKKVEQDGEVMTVTTYFGDYKEVKSVKVPFNIIQNVGIELDIKMSKITINEGVKDADFQ
jgi:zinc protease